MIFKIRDTKGIFYAKMGSIKDRNDRDLIEAEDLWRRERLPTPVFWPGEFHGLYNPWGRKELDTTEWLLLPLFFILFVYECQLRFYGTRDYMGSPV